MDCDSGGDWGFGFGWIFPAFIIGKLISDAFDRRAPAQPAYAPPPTAPAASPHVAAPPAAAHAAPASTIACQHCGQASDTRFAFCPHCGHKLSPAACRYCGQQLNPALRLCGHCGAPRR